MISYANMHAVGLSNKPFIVCVRWILSPLDLIFQHVGVLFLQSYQWKIMITTS